MHDNGARGLLPGAAASAVLHPSHDLEPAPDLAHCPHLHVHQTLREPDRANPVLCEIGCHSGRLLGPRDPQHAGRCERALERREAALELPPPVGEELNEIDRAGDAWPARHPRRQLTQDTIIALRRIEDRDPRIRLDPQLGDQRLARVPSHLYGPLPPSTLLYRPLSITRPMVPPASSVIY